MRPNNITTAIALALIPFTAATTAATEDQSLLPASNTNTNANANLIPKTTTLTLTAYEFPFCLASDKEILQDFFISRPTYTNLTITDPPSFASPNGKCVPINASKGIPHSFYYTVHDDEKDGDGRRSVGDACQLLTFEKEGCEGKVTRHSLREEVGEGDGGRSKCFSRPDRFVKALLESARIECS